MCVFPVVRNKKFSGKRDCIKLYTCGLSVFGNKNWYGKGVCVEDTCVFVVSQ